MSAKEQPLPNPSQHEANKVARVLAGQAMAYTCRLHLTNGEVVEFQCNKTPVVQWCDQDRSMWLYQSHGQYGGEKVPVMRWPDGAILLTEENPK